MKFTGNETFQEKIARVAVPATFRRWVLLGVATKSLRFLYIQFKMYLLIRNVRTFSFGFICRGPTFSACIRENDHGNSPSHSE